MTLPANGYRIKPLALDPSGLDGLSERLVRSHHENNYSGAARRLTSIRKELALLDWSKAATFVVNGLKREELIAANSAFLHELYFSCLGGNGELRQGGLTVALARDFGSVHAWRNEFIALARAMGGGSGWALLSWSMHENRLVNHWAADHTDLLAGAVPILALDMYEHAYHLDYGANAGAYVEAFMRNIDWDAVGDRYAEAVAQGTAGQAIASSEVMRQEIEIIDVRRHGAFQSSGEMIAGATWRDPERVHEWASELPQSRPVALYCVFGHEVCQSTAAILRMHGVDARYVAGGIEEWKARGLPLQRKEV